MYEPRTYRHWIKDNDLVSFNVTVKETDLYIRAQRELEDEALKSILKHRTPLEKYIESHPAFLTTLEPYHMEEDAPAIAREMAKAAQIAGVGPMAAVAGTIAEAVGRDLLAFSPEIIVENGGDIFLRTAQTRVVGIYAGKSPFTGKIALEIKPEDTPLGICTSSGMLGHSLSLGAADALIVLSASTPLADAAATALGNLVKDQKDIPKVVQRAQSINGLHGIVIIKGDKIGLWGKVKILPL